LIILKFAYFLVADADNYYGEVLTGSLAGTFAGRVTGAGGA
jgi:hypothetical protein